MASVAPGALGSEGSWGNIIIITAFGCSFYCFLIKEVLVVLLALAVFLVSI